MHIPDGFLDAKTAVATGLISTVALGVAVRQAHQHLPPRKVPLLGLSAAFVFAAQMLNFPVAGGTSGHMVGGVLVAALLGPSCALIVIASVLLVQCFMFADGGVTALGANILNMGLISGVAGWVVYAALTQAVRGLFGRIMAATFASWVGTVLAAIVCAGELATSHTVPWSVAFPAMAGVHMLIGIGEGLITALVLVTIARTRPELVLEPVGAPTSRSYGALAAYGVLVALGMALFISPLASQWPDGLDKAAEELGFASRTKVLLPGPMADYKIPWIHVTPLSTAIAGATGTVIALLLSWGLARALVPKAAPSVPDRTVPS